MWEQGGREVAFEEKTMRDWQEGTFNHLVGESFGSSVVVSRMSAATTDADVASFFRNFHLSGNGVTLIQDVRQIAIYIPSIAEYSINLLVWSFTYLLFTDK